MSDEEVEYCPICQREWNLDEWSRPIIEWDDIFEEDPSNYRSNEVMERILDCVYGFEPYLRKQICFVLRAEEYTYLRYSPDLHGEPIIDPEGEATIEGYPVFVKPVREEEK